jgi:hypothetical protein
MKTCDDCSRRKTCKRPCGWLRAQLKSVTSKKKEITFTELKKSDFCGEFN